MKYVETRDRNPISGHLASEIRRHARAIFVGLAQEGHLFNSWTEADHNSLKVYYNEMAERFEELRLCANDWKAEMIALDIYRTWRDQWQKRMKKAGENVKNEKSEDCDNSHDSDNEGSESVKKHNIDCVPPENRASKKIKSGNSTTEPVATFLGYDIPAAGGLHMPQSVSKCVIGNLICDLLIPAC